MYPTQAFMESVVGRLRSCVDEDIFIPLYPKKSVSFLLLLLLRAFMFNISKGFKRGPAQDFVIFTLK